MSWWKRVDPYNPKPVYSQIKEAIYIAIARGELAPGDKLPPIRDLAKEIGVNPGTVARAYRELAEEGIISTRAGGGSHINPHISKQIDDLKKRLLNRHIRQLIELSREVGITESELIGFIKGVLKKNG